VAVLCDIERDGSIHPHKQPMLQRLRERGLVAFSEEPLAKVKLTSHAQQLLSKRGVGLNESWNRELITLDGSTRLMKVEGIYDCESDYDSDQAEAEDVSDIVTRYASAGAFSILLAGAGPPIGFFILGRQLVRHELPLPLKLPRRSGRGWLSARGGWIVMVTPRPFLMSLEAAK
jgi:hypothetical protein